MAGKTTLKLVVVVVAVLAVAAGVITAFSGVFGGRTSQIRVACIGDSITEVTGYPADLQMLLGGGYTVKNFGVTGATILLNTDRPYLNQTAFKSAEQFQPQIVIIMLGTNDARTNIYASSENLEVDFKTLIAAFQGFASKPRVFFATPPPIFNNTLSLSSTNLDEGVLPRVEQTANQLGIRIIDVYSTLTGHPEYFPDGVHPNAEGAEVIAATVRNAIIPNAQLSPDVGSACVHKYVCPAFFHLGWIWE